MKAKHAAITIVSKNYFAYATTLAQSYREHHPDHDFLIVLADSADGSVPATLPCGADVIEIARFAIPDISRFIYRYTIMELCTAVKPFVLADLFRRRVMRRCSTWTRISGSSHPSTRFMRRSPVRRFF